MGTESEARSLKNRLAEAEENLQLIREYRSWHVLQTDVKPQYVKEERRLVQEIEELQAQLAQIEADMQAKAELGPHINDPLSLAELGSGGPACLFLKDTIKARSHSNCEEALLLFIDAVECVGKHVDRTQLALAYLYQADAHARNNGLKAGIKLAEQAKRILRIWGDRHNTLVAQLLIARLQASRSSKNTRREYLEALALCRKLESEKKETAQSEEARLYEQIIEEIQQVLNDVSIVTKKPYAQRYPLNSILFLSLSDGPDAIVGRSRVIDYRATGEFRIEGGTYFLYRLDGTEGHTSELQHSAVHFVLPVPEDGWPSPISKKEEDFALVRQEAQVTQEVPGVLWRNEQWVTGRFERDATTGSTHFVALKPLVIGREIIEVEQKAAGQGCVIGLLKPSGKTPRHTELQSL